MAIADDFTVTVAGNIRAIGTPSQNWPVIDLHRWLQDIADDEFPAVALDILDITSQTPSERSTDNIINLINGYNIDDDAAEYLFGGSITQDGGDTKYSGLKVLGAVNDTNTQLMVIQNDEYYRYTATPAAPYWGDQSGGGYNGDAVGGVLMRVMLKTRTAGVDLDLKNVRVQARAWGDSYDFFNVTLGDGEAVAAIGTTPDAQSIAIGTVQGWGGGDIPTNTEGYQQIDINNGLGDFPYYSQWHFNSNTLGMKATWNWIKELTGNDDPDTLHSRNGELFIGITHSWDYQSGAAYQEDETLVWGTRITYGSLVSGPFVPGNIVTIGVIGAAGMVVFDDGSNELTVALEDPTVTVADLDIITEFSPDDGAATGTTAAVDTAIVDNDKEGGRGILLAGTGAATGTSWIQLISGKAPVDTLQIRGVSSTSTGVVDGSVALPTQPKVFLGSYTGSLIGAYGIGIEPDDLSSTDTVWPLVGAVQDPPNNVTFELNDVEIGEDRVLIGKKAGGLDFDWDEMTIEAGNDLDQASGETSVVVAAPGIPDDAPQTGVLRISLDDGRHRRIAYLSHDKANTFTIADVDWSGDLSAAAGKGVMLAFIDLVATTDPQAFTLQYDQVRSLFIRVRDGGVTPIKTYEAAGSLGAAGGSASASRISDV
jgi:hypothetical protein